jgi:hypothetical protein
MTEKSENCLTEKHLQLFGAIIRWFARYELLMLDLTAAVAGSDASAIMILTRNLDFSDKRLALIDLLRHRAIPFDQYDRICDYLTVPNTFLTLRNDIAHSAWVHAPNPYLIQPVWIFRRRPGVKPLHGDPDTPGGRYVECDEDKLDYSLETLAEAVETLASNYGNFAAYVHENMLSGRK